MTKYRFVICIFLVCVIASCTHAPTVEEQELLKSKLQEEAEWNQVKNAELALNDGQFEKAQFLYNEFIKGSSSSIYHAKAKLGLAEALFGQRKYADTVQLLREVRDKNLYDNKSIAALASFKLSEVYEAQQETDKMIASLLEADSQKDYLPEDIAYAEIPAKLAVAYSKLKRSAESAKWLKTAENGIKKTNEILGFDRTRIARTYFNMGSISVQSSNDFFVTTEALKVIQVYLIKGLKMEDVSWSLKARNRLVENYEYMLQQLKLMPGESRSQIELKARAGGALTSVLADAELYAPISEMNYKKGEKELFKYIQEAKNKIRLIAFETDNSRGLTDAAKDRNSIKKEFNLVDPDAKVERKALDSEDPNL